MAADGSGRKDKGQRRDHLVGERACLRWAARDDRRLMGCLDQISDCAEGPVGPHKLPRIEAFKGETRRNRAIFEFYKLTRLIELADRRALAEQPPFTAWDRESGVPELWRTFITDYVDFVVALHSDLVAREQCSPDPLKLPSAVTFRLLREAQVPFNRLGPLESELAEFETRLDAARFASDVRRMRELRQQIERNHHEQMKRTVELLAVFFGTSTRVDSGQAFSGSRIRASDDRNEENDSDGPDDADEDSTEPSAQDLEKLQVFVCREVPVDRLWLPNAGNLKVRHSFIIGMIGQCCVERCLRVRSHAEAEVHDGRS